MSFPLYRRPGAVVFLDDDLDYLEMLGEVMPEDWFVHLMLRPAACIGRLLDETTFTELDMWRQQDIVNRWRSGTALIPQILKYWREDGIARFTLAQVCVVDYSMPAMSGLKVLSDLTSWLGSRILLTGRADEQMAVSAFNRGLIDQFIPKQSPDIRQRLTDAIRGLLDKPNQRHEQTWRATLTREQSALLSDSVVSGELDKLAAKQGWVEHVAIGVPFGILALDSKAQAMWLQLEPPDRLAELAEMAASQGWDTSTTAQIRSGQKLIDLELQLELGADQKARPREAFVMGGGAACLYAALFDINETFCPLTTDSYQQFLDRGNQRQIQD
jgi:CheY-like chemotaxis protein